MDFEKMECAVEAILFATGRAVPAEDIAKALGTDTETAMKYAEALMEKWNSEARGTEILRLEDSFQMCTRKEFYPELITLELNPKKPRLSESALETLSVIAYKQPVTKAEIERIRGVNSDHAVNRLIEFKLVRELGRASQPGRPILFGTTQDFLRLFGVSSTDNLPDISPVQLEDFREEAEKEAELRVDI
jgi:segregation and condensation protein B